MRRKSSDAREYRYTPIVPKETVRNQLSDKAHSLLGKPGGGEKVCAASTFQCAGVDGSGIHIALLDNVWYGWNSSYCPPKPGDHGVIHSIRAMRSIDPRER